MADDKKGNDSGALRGALQGILAPALSDRAAKLAAEDSSFREALTMLHGMVGSRELTQVIVSSGFGAVAGFLGGKLGGAKGDVFQDLVEDFGEQLGRLYAGSATDKVSQEDAAKALGQMRSRVGRLLEIAKQKEKRMPDKSLLQLIAELPDEGHRSILLSNMKIIGVYAHKIEDVKVLQMLAVQPPATWLESLEVTYGKQARVAADKADTFSQRIAGIFAPEALPEDKKRERREEHKKRMDEVAARKVVLAQAVKPDAPFADKQTVKTALIMLAVLAAFLIVFYIITRSV